MATRIPKKHNVEAFLADCEHRKNKCFIDKIAPDDRKFIVETITRIEKEGLPISTRTLSEKFTEHLGYKVTRNVINGLRDRVRHEQKAGG